MDTVGRLVGLPSSKRAVRKFLLRTKPDITKLNVEYETFETDKVCINEYFAFQSEMLADVSC